MAFHGLLYISEARISAHIFHSVTWREDVARNNILNEELMGISVPFSNWINAPPFDGSRQLKTTN